MFNRLRATLNRWRHLLHEFDELRSSLNHDKGVQAEINQDLERRLARLSMTISERTEVHADIHMHAESTVIVIGRYQGRDYVRAFNLPAQSLPSIIEYLRATEHGARRGRFDIIPGLDVRAVYDRETF